MTHTTEKSIETLLIHADRGLNSTSAVVAPIYQTANFRGESGADFAKRAGEARHPEFYTRYGNPTLSQVEGVLAALEGTEAALVTGSGMAAVSATVLTIVGKEDHVVAQTNHYGGTTNLLQKLLPRFGVEVTQVDQRDSSAFERAVRPHTKLILVETPSNPLMTLTDLRAVVAIAKARGIITLIDNTFATPLNQRPVDLGIDLVFHSATKYFGGHSDIIAGAVMGSKDWITKIWNTHVILGAALGPFDAWLMLRGLRTLALRIRQHNENAMELARALEKHPAVKAVHYPGLISHPQHDLAKRQMSGFGGMLGFEVKGGYEAADRFLSGLRLASRAASLGGVETLAVHPASNFLHYMTLEEAAKIGIAPGLLRISVGLEGKDDLISDFERALT
ncbi:MAG TPA: aminotransferase class I/II-fold pyridoxal phosphate-dependent enzyme [Terriglobales bacterium]|jgi:cystathionine beta-lyase/cystathionine gamma-synthase|nr:aminotransferase class I/II-fold pyridoxal phosphate-dependent enzyme [Terriglobales bacterium]